MFVTNDLGTAAFLLVKGCQLSNAYVNSKNIYVFEFKGDINKNRQVAIEYLNSDCSKFDAQIKNLKNILKQRV